MTETKPLNLVLCIRSETSPSSYGDPTYCHTYAAVRGWRVPTQEPTSVYTHESPLAKLLVSCHYSSDTAYAKSYGWEVGIESPYCLTTLQEAEEMVKALRPLLGRMEKIANEHGRPATFGHFVAHVAKAAKVRAWCWHTKHGWHYSTDINDLIYHIDEDIRLFHNTHGKTEKVTD